MPDEPRKPTPQLRLLITRGRTGWDAKPVVVTSEASVIQAALDALARLQTAGDPPPPPRTPPPGTVDLIATFRTPEVSHD